MLRFAALALVCLSLSTSAFAQSPAHKLGPGIKMAIQAASTDSKALKRAIGTGEMVSVLIKGSPSGVRSAIAQVGGRAGATVGEITTARVSPGSLVALAGHPSVVRIERSMPKQIRNTQAAVHVKAASAHQGDSPLTQAYTGKGVIVGVIDTGIDFMHKDFRDPRKTRTRAGSWRSGIWMMKEGPRRKDSISGQSGRKSRSRRQSGEKAPCGSRIRTGTVHTSPDRLPGTGVLMDHIAAWPMSQT